MVKEANFPLATGTAQLLLQPGELLPIHVVAVQYEKANAELGPERIVPFSVHVEVFVEALIGIIMVSKGSVKLNARIQERFIGNLKLALEIARALASVKVVSHHQDEIKGKLGSPL